MAISSGELIGVDALLQRYARHRYARLAAHRDQPPLAHRLAALLHRSVPFCMRCDSSSTFTAITQFMRSGRDEAVVTLPPPNRRDAVDYECPRQASTVRLIRQVTPTGKVRVLMTSLRDAERYPAAAFATLYHQRWRIEEAFKRVKHRLNLEHTSRLTWLAACQDTGANDDLAPGRRAVRRNRRKPPEIHAQPLPTSTCSAQTA